MVSPSFFVQNLLVRAGFSGGEEMLFFVFFSIYQSESGLSNIPVVLSAFFSPIQVRQPPGPESRACIPFGRPLPSSAARYFRVKRHSGLKTGAISGILYSIDFPCACRRARRSAPVSADRASRRESKSVPAAHKGISIDSDGWIFQQMSKKDDTERFECGYLKTQPPKILPVGLCSDAKRRRRPIFRGAL